MNLQYVLCQSERFLDEAISTLEPQAPAARLNFRPSRKSNWFSPGHLFLIDTSHYYCTKTSSGMYRSLSLDMQAYHLLHINVRGTLRIMSSSCPASLYRQRDRHEAP